jgi:hypothetical protein
MTNLFLLDKIPYNDAVKSLEFVEGELAGIMGPPQAGKSLYALEQGYTIGNTLIVNTEEPSPQFIKSWVPVFQKKYKTDMTPIVKYKPFAQDLLDYVGIKGKLELGTKNEFKLSEWDIENAPIKKDVEKNKIKYVIIDSMTAPFSLLMAGGRQNMPLRTQVEELFFAGMNSLLAENPIYAFTNNHISLNPTQPYLSREQMLLKGGKTIGHFTKLLTYLEHRNKPHGYRKLWIVRYHDLPEWQLSNNVLITDNGYRGGLTEEELEQMKEDAKAK